jgi:protein FRA10AC1
MRWRIEKEVMEGKGQFICGDKRCQSRDSLKSWEVNFGYIEHNEKKNALVKLRNYIPCLKTLNSD